ncbi:MAG: hypothetical protein N3B21_15915 [Clostridia bacterium]|nr:hypothetical protein [Clostridia bacterium]
MRNVSTKELNYINDLLSWELLAAKKCNQYAYQENNSGYEQIFFDASRVHQQNYINLLSYLNQLNAEQGGQAH